MIKYCDEGHNLLTYNCHVAQPIVQSFFVVTSHMYIPENKTDGVFEGGWYVKIVNLIKTQLLNIFGKMEIHVSLSICC